MSYAGYRIIINGTTVPNGMIQKGTWEFTPRKRLVSKWTDANQVEHRDTLQARKADISFSIKVRSEAEHESIRAIFNQLENISVTYYDDGAGTYKTGSFYMEEAPKFSHKNTADGIRYNATQVHLVEY